MIRPTDTIESTNESEARAAVTAGPRGSTNEGGESVATVPRSHTVTTLNDAIKAFQGEMKRGMWRTNSYERYTRELERFAAHVDGTRDVLDIGTRDARSFLDTFDNHAASTVALEHTILSSFWKTLLLDELVAENPMLKIKRPKVPALRDRKRVRISTPQLEAMLTACRTWPERLCLNSFAYWGVRRTALANLRWSDVDGKRWTAAFLEKGGKRIEKPIPHELRELFVSYALDRGFNGTPIHGDEWVVPNKRAMSQYTSRSPRIVYVLVTDVAKRVGVHAHCHAIRAAFACHFLRTNPAMLEALRQLMGHSSINTTQGYLDELEGQDTMRIVETLSYVTDLQLGAAA